MKKKVTAWEGFPRFSKVLVFCNQFAAQGILYAGLPGWKLPDETLHGKDEHFESRGPAARKFK